MGGNFENYELKKYFIYSKVATIKEFPIFKSCALLGDGRVLVAGGYHGMGSPDPSDLSTAEVTIFQTDLVWLKPSFRCLTWPQCLGVRLEVFLRGWMAMFFFPLRGVPGPARFSHRF